MDHGGLEIVFRILECWFVQVLDAKRIASGSSGLQPSWGTKVGYLVRFDNALLPRSNHVLPAFSRGRPGCQLISRQKPRQRSMTPLVVCFINKFSHLAVLRFGLQKVQASNTNSLGRD